MPERVKVKDGVEPKPFWETKSLEEMTAAEWESLCDGCGRCCLNKLEDEDTGEIVLTRLSCALLDIGQCRCSDYANRFDKMPDCINLTPEKVRTLKWLPATCGYRRVKEGRGLAWWHPLLSGDPETVHQAGISVRGFARSEKGVRAWLGSWARSGLPAYPRSPRSCQAQNSVRVEMCDGQSTCAELKMGPNRSSIAAYR